MKRTLATLAVGAMSALPLAAQDIGGFELGAGLSTFGPMVEGQVSVGENFAIRGFIAGGLSNDGTFTETDATFTYDAQLGGFGVLVDYLPFESGFKLSGGVIKSNIGADFTASANSIIIGGTTYGVDAELTGEVKFERDLAPVLAVGYDFNLTDKITLGTSLGAMFAGDLDVSARSTGTQDIAQADIDREVQSIKNEIPSMDAIPYVAISIRYRF